MLRRFPCFVALTLIQAACFAPVSPDGGERADGGTPFDAGWEDVEQACDGYDNDGDGRIDISRPVFLGTSANPYWDWEWDGTRLVSTWAEDGVRYGIHSRDLGTHQDFLADPTENMTGRISRLTGRVALSWQRRAKDGGSAELLAAIVGPDAGLRMLASLFVGPMPSPRGSHPLFIAEPRDRSCIVIKWQNECAGWEFIGLSLAQDGGVLAGPIGLLRSTVMPGCGTIVRPTPMIPFGRSQLMSAYALFRLDGGVVTQVFDPFDCSFDRGGLVWGFPAPAPWQTSLGVGGYNFLRALEAEDGTRAGEHAVLRLETGRSQLWHQRADGGGRVAPAVAFDSFPAAEGTTEPFMAWREPDFPAVPTGYFAQGMSQRLTLTLPGFLVTPWIASIGSGLSAVAFTLDGGSYPDGSPRYLRYGQLFCDPH